MENDYISREAVLAIFDDVHPLDYNAQAYQRQISKIPFADVRPVVYCKDCELWGTTLSDKERKLCANTDTDLVCDYWMSDGLLPHDFCSYGRMRGADMTGGADG